MAANLGGVIFRELMTIRNLVFMSSDALAVASNVYLESQKQLRGLPTGESMVSVCVPVGSRGYLLHIVDEHFPHGVETYGVAVELPGKRKMSYFHSPSANAGALFDGKVVHIPISAEAAIRRMLMEAYGLL